MADRAPRPKVVIPALINTKTLDRLKSFKKGRTPHACDHCRNSKSGCTGDQPCVRCKSSQIACIYGDGKRDKERKYDIAKCFKPRRRLTKLSQDTIILQQHNTEICDALRRIQLEVAMPQDQMRLAIDEVLAMKPPDLSADKQENRLPISEQALPRADRGGSDEEEDQGTGMTSAASDGENETEEETSDRVPYSQNRPPPLDGWPNVMERETESTTHQSPALWVYDSGTKLIAYATEDSDTEEYDTSNVQVFEWPHANVADKLVQSYFINVHPVVPILEQSSFMEQYNNFLRGSSNLSQDDLVFLGTLNIVFAISAVFSTLTHGRLRHHHNGHLHYLARAKILCLDQGLLYKDVRLSTTSALGILCLYFIITNEFNRAWTFCAVAIRHATKLDLHLRNKADHLQQQYKEHRLRLWWSLYSLECSLNELTGRPSCISGQDISTPLPVNMGTEYTHTIQSLHDRLDVRQGSRSQRRRGSWTSRGRLPSDLHNTGLVAQDPATRNFAPSFLTTSSTYFIFRIQLCIISHEITTRLYSTAITQLKWSDIQDAICRIDQRLLSWRRNLPVAFNIDFDVWAEPNWNDQNVLAGMGLAIQLCHSRIILFRPYLCRFDRRILSHGPGDFDQEAVDTCLKSAREMITLLSAPARSVQTLYAIKPWWNILHQLCEALSVLLLDMAFQSQHAPERTTSTLEEAKKGVRWLSKMSEQSISARKAWEIFDRLIRDVAPVVSWSMFDLPTAAPVPPGYIPYPHNRPQEKEMADYDPSDIGGTWPQDQLGFNYDQNFDSTCGSLPQERKMVSNPLDHATACERFATIAKLHGQYDEPWQYMFQFSRHEQEGGGTGQYVQGALDPLSEGHAPMQTTFDLQFNDFTQMYLDL